MAKGRSRKRRRPAAQAVRAGMPAKDSVREIITKVAPTGIRFRILRTTEMDSYDKPPRSGKRQSKRARKR
jgi:hypothetical protein